MSQSPERISRREAVRRVSLLLGGVAFTGGNALFAAVESGAAGEQSLFTADQVALLDEIADTILPETDTPGAKAAAVGPFVARMVADTYYPDDQAVFKAGLATLEAGGEDFMALSPEDRLARVEALDREQHTHQNQKSGDQPNHWFRMMKELTLLGYFTSEIGVTQAQQYREAPGHYDPCAPYSPGDRSWARHA